VIDLLVLAFDTAVLGAVFGVGLGSESVEGFNPTCSCVLWVKLHRYVARLFVSFT
jgi:hypothetical protein